jgi:nicotinamidase-related amidase
MADRKNRLGPDNAALLLIDHQTGLLSNVKTIEATVLKTSIIALAELAKVYDLPVVLTTSFAEGPNGPILPELVKSYPDVEVINRTLINAWDDKAFVDAVIRTGRKKLIMAGIVTDVCLTFPAIDAVADGYDVYAVVDASGTWNRLIEEAAIHRMAQAGVITTNWAAVAAELQRDWSLPTGSKLGAVFAEYLTPYRFVMDSHQAKVNK